MDNYLQLVQRISESAKIEKQEIERRVEAKRAKLSGLVSKEGAAQIVASELGINFDKEKLKISQLVQSMRRANTLGKIIQLAPVREFNKNNRQGKVVSFTLADETSNIRVVLWDTNHISLIESEKIKLGDIVEISNAAIRNSELHLSSLSDIKLSNEQFDNVITEKSYSLAKLKDARPGINLKARALIIQLFEPRFFDVCPECNKKLTDSSCNVHGKVLAKKRALLNLVLDDGTDNIRSVLFGDSINKLGLTDDDIFTIENFIAKKESLLGEEMFFSGNIRLNALFNRPEFNIENVESVRVDELIRQFETQAG